MKANLSHKAALAAAALIASLATASTHAGPGPQYWANLGRNAAKAESAKPAASVSDGHSMLCRACKSRDALAPVYGYFPGGEIDDYRVEWIRVGTLHSCKACGGETQTALEKTNSDMKSNCPICAKTVPTCCKRSA